MWDLAEIKKKIQEAKEEVLLRATHLKVQIHALKLSTSLDYGHSKEFHYVISDKLPKSIGKAKCYKSAQEKTDSL